MPKLRGHHLICLQFFDGEGYDERFIRNLEHVLRQAEAEEVTVTSGADDVCAACLHLKQGKCEHSENADEEIHEMDKKALELLGLLDSDKVRWDLLRSRVGEVFSEWYQDYCLECDWRGVCEKHY